MSATPPAATAAAVALTPPAGRFRAPHVVTEPPESTTLALARLLAGIGFVTLPAGTRARALEAVGDALACAVGGAPSDLARLYREALGMAAEPPAATTEAVPATATVIGAGLRAEPAAAAFHNAVAINALDYDDTARVSGHPGAAVVAAALATAEATGAGGADFLAGVVAGYEAAFRVARACRPSAEQYALVHGSQCFLPFGAAAAAGRVLGLDAEAMARALGIAAAHAPVPAATKFGFDEPQLSWQKDNVHQPAEVGVRAALLAARGYPASRTVFDGDRGYWRMINSDRFEAEALTDPELAAVPELAFKPYPCCRWLHAALDAATLALQADPRPPARLAAVRLETIGMVAAAFGNRRPLSMVDAEFSAPHALALHLLGVPHVAWWREAHRTAPEVVALMDKLVLAEDPALSAAFLAGGRNVNRLPARVRLVWDDGAERAAFCDFPMGAPGRPGYGRADDPLDEEGHMRRKRAALLGLVLDGAGIAAFAATLAALPQAPGVGALVAPLAAPAPAP